MQWNINCIGQSLQGWQQFSTLLLLSFLHLGAICPGLYPPILLGVKTSSSSSPFPLSSLFSPVFPLPAENGLFSKLISTDPRPPASHLLSSSSSSRFSILFLGRLRLVVAVGSRSSAFLPDSSNARHPHIWHSARCFHYPAEYFVNDQGAAL